MPETLRAATDVHVKPLMVLMAMVAVVLRPV
jgi:hypothetical protein